MKQSQTHPKRTRSWRFHAPGTMGTVYAMGTIEEEAIELLARVLGATVSTDQTLFEGKGGWVLQNKLSGEAMHITHGQPV